MQKSILAGRSTAQLGPLGLGPHLHLTTQGDWIWYHRGPPCLLLGSPRQQSGLTCESQQKGRQEGGQGLPKCGSHGRRLTVSLVCARHPPPDEALHEPRSHCPSPDRWTSHLPDTLPPPAWCGSVSHSERSGYCGPSFFLNPKPSSLRSLAEEVPAALGLDADYFLCPVNQSRKALAPPQASATELPLRW